MGDEWAGSDDEIARAALASSPNAVVALDRDESVLVWNAAAERLFGWTADQIVGRRAPIVPDELGAEHNAVLERVRTGAPVSLRTKRVHSNGCLLDVRVDISALRLGSAVAGYVCVYHPARADEMAELRMARRARLVRRLTDVVADINSELELSAVLDRISASLTELTGADAGGFVLIEGERLRLVSTYQLPESLRGPPPACARAWSTGSCAPARPSCWSPVGSTTWCGRGWTACTRSRSASPPWAGARTGRSTRCSPGARPGTWSWSCWSCWPGTRASPSATRWPTRRRYASGPTSGPCSTPAPTASPCSTRTAAWCAGTRPPPC
ncbi:PAS domain S-box protein [Nonomuraea antimicrobica]